MEGSNARDRTELESVITPGAVKNCVRYGPFRVKGKSLRSNQINATNGGIVPRISIEIQAFTMPDLLISPAE